MKNSLVKNEQLPDFKNIHPENIATNLDQLLNENRARIAALLAHSQTYTYDDLVYPLEILDDRLQKYWSPITHLHAVAQTDKLRTAYQACLPKLTAYSTEIEQNETLYQAFEALATSAAYKKLDIAQQKLIQDQLRDFRLSGVALPPKEKQRYAEIQTQLAQQTNHFEENILDATQGWTKHITDEKELAGIPAHAITQARATAQQKNLDGWLFTLEFPSYYAVISYAHERTLRETMYQAYVTRASDQGPNAGKFDNTKVMTEILQLRNELSQLLGFKHYAELSLTTKMVKKPQQVLDFLQQLIDTVRPKALQELQELAQFAKQQLGIADLKPWDVAYASEKLREKDYGISDESLRPYFPEEKVLTGLFELVTRLYNINVQEIKNVVAWHPDVRFFEIRDQKNELRGQFYLDLYARPHKRGGAWMDNYCDRMRYHDGTVQTPIAYLTCNLTPPNAGKPALFTHDEIVTLFHEFGHGLHHMLTKIEYAGVSGINGVQWDAVELPSQFMEFFTWEKSVLKAISSHYETGEHLPENLAQRMIDAKHFHTGLHLLRQLEFALFDFRLHMEFAPSKDAKQVQTLLDEIRATISVIPVPAYNRFQHSFSHIFAGGYSAGYYSYLWAEMLASDAFAKFEENGVFDASTGQSFLKNILERGGSQDALELFIAFRRREPTIDALLKHHGITQNT